LDFGATLIYISVIASQIPFRVVMNSKGHFKAVNISHYINGILSVFMFLSIGLKCPHNNIERYMVFFQNTVYCIWMVTLVTC